MGPRPPHSEKRVSSPLEWCSLRELTLKNDAGFCGSLDNNFSCIELDRRIEDTNGNLNEAFFERIRRLEKYNFKVTILVTEMEKEKKVLAACRLFCNECDIYKATDDPEVAQETVDWFKREMDINLTVEEIRCSSCKGNRKTHWSSDCDILNYCVDEKGLEFCYQCEDFPCVKLKNWADESSRYKDALSRLTRMKSGESLD